MRITLSLFCSLNIQFHRLLPHLLLFSCFYSLKNTTQVYMHTYTVSSFLHDSGSSSGFFNYYINLSISVCCDWWHEWPASKWLLHPPTSLSICHTVKICGMYSIKRPNLPVLAEDTNLIQVRVGQASYTDATSRINWWVLLIFLITINK